MWPLGCHIYCKSEAVIIIKKYPNRRLYDTSKSQYVNLGSIKELVKKGRDFKVIDSKSEAELTKSILLQIISELESADQTEILTQTVLRELIRFYDSDMRDLMRQYLQHSVSVFVEQEDSIRTAMEDFTADVSVASIVKQLIAPTSSTDSDSGQASSKGDS